MQSLTNRYNRCPIDQLIICRVAIEYSCHRLVISGFTYVPYVFLFVPLDVANGALIGRVYSSSKIENSINLVSPGLKKLLTVQQATQVWHPAGPSVLDFWVTSKKMSAWCGRQNSRSKFGHEKRTLKPSNIEISFSFKPSKLADESQAIFLLYFLTTRSFRFALPAIPTSIY